MTKNGPERLLRAGIDPEKARFAAIMLHGRGAGAGDLLPITDELGFDDGAYLFPQAPGGSWYPFSFLEPIERNEPALSRALQRIGELVRELIEAGLETDRICLLGFSQGACLASEYAARNPVRYGGIFALSGGLIGPPGTVFGHKADLVSPRVDLVSHKADLGGTPVLLGCGDPDPHIPRDRVEETAEILNRMGAHVDLRLYSGIGHTVVEDEIRAVRTILGAIPGR